MIRWTMEQLEQADDIDFAICILNERRGRLTPHFPLSEKLSEAARTLDNIKKERDRYLQRITRVPEMDADDRTIETH